MIGGQDHFKLSGKVELKPSAPASAAVSAPSRASDRTDSAALAALGGDRRPDRLKFSGKVQLKPSAPASARSTAAWRAGALDALGDRGRPVLVDGK